MNVRGQWVQMSADEIQAALDFWKSEGAERRVTCATSCRWRWARRSRPGGMDFEGVSADGLDRRSARPARGQRRLRRAAAARGLPRHAAALPGARLLLAGLPRGVGPGRLPGRRHGPGQDHPGAGARSRATGSRRPQAPRAPDLPDVGGRQLAEGGGALHARPAA